MIAITGADGFIGGRLVARLTARGVPVRGLVLAPDPARNQAAFRLGEPLAPEALAGVTALVHTAHDFSPRGEAALAARNREGTARLFDAAAAADVTRMLFVSSLAAFDGARSAYGRVKRAIERDVAARGGHSLRPGTVYGVPHGGLFAGLDAAVRKLPVLPDFGPRAALKLVQADDLVRVIEAWTDGASPAPGEPVVAAHPETVTMRRLLEVLAAVAHVPARFVPVPPDLALAGLRAMEAAGLTPPFRSDSLIGMLYGNPEPRAIDHALGVPLRSFGPESLVP